MIITKISNLTELNKAWVWTHRKQQTQTWRNFKLQGQAHYHWQEQTTLQPVDSSFTSHVYFTQRYRWERHHTLHFLLLHVAPLMDAGCVNRRWCHIVSWRWWWWWQQIMRLHTCNTSFSACHLTTCSHTNLFRTLPLPPPTIHTETNSYKPSSVVE